MYKGFDVKLSVTKFRQKVTEAKPGLWDDFVLKGKVSRKNLRDVIDTKIASHIHKKRLDVPDIKEQYVQQQKITGRCA